MPLEVKNINPLDLQPRKAIGVSLPFSATAVFNSTYQTKDAIKVNLLNFLLTGTGERYFNPTFGTGLRRQLFSNLEQSTLSGIKEIIQDSIRLYFPNILIRNIAIEGRPDNNTINFYLNYSIRNTEVSNEEININFLQ